MVWTGSGVGSGMAFTSLFVITVHCINHFTNFFYGSTRFFFFIHFFRALMGKLVSQEEKVREAPWDPGVSRDSGELLEDL